MDIADVLARVADQADDRAAEGFASLICDEAPGLVRLAANRPNPAQVWP